MNDKIIHFSPELYAYYQKHAMREDSNLQILRQETLKLATHRMQIAPEQGGLLQLLIGLMGAIKTLEIGTFTGYSALAVALALPENGEITVCDLNSEWLNIAQSYWRKAGVYHKFTIKIGPACDSLAELLSSRKENHFDFVFIDADKVNYIHYYEAALKLVRPGGLIAIDNVLWSGQLIHADDNRPSTKVIRELNEKIIRDKRVEMAMLPIADGLTLARKKPLHPNHAKMQDL